MRKFILFVVLAGIAGAQTMTEFGAAAAGGTAGGAAGKKVSDGISSIFGKVDQQTKDAAKTKEDAKPATPSAPAATATATDSAPPAPSANSGGGSGGTSAPAAKSAASAKPTQAAKTSTATKTAVKASPSARVAHLNPPDPPNSVPDPPPPTQRAVRPAPPPPPKQEVAVTPILPPPPPPPVATADELKAITPGTVREDVLKLGAPASRISMFDDGHLLEIYTYASKDSTFAVVRLNDGEVSRVELR